MSGVFRLFVVLLAALLGSILLGSVTLLRHEQYLDALRKEFRDFRSTLTHDVKEYIAQEAGAAAEQRGRVERLCAAIQQQPDNKGRISAGVNDVQRPERNATMATTRTPANGAESLSLPRGRTPQQYRVHVYIFTYSRIVGLMRLYKSLVEADYLGHRVDLTIYIDNKKKTPDKEGTPDFGTGFSDDGTMEWIQRNVLWEHGDLRIHRREKNAGLKRSIMEAWYPVNEHTFGVFFEDDTEASPLWYKWVDRALRKYYFVPDRPKRLIGLSLYRPIHDELTGRDWGKQFHLEGHKPFLFQQPCSWGALYFPGAWREFRDWFPTVQTDPKLPWSTPSNEWFWWDSWKKFLILHMWDHGLYMVYPNLPDRMVLSTNHLMKGAHNTPAKLLFLLPLLTREKYEEGGDGLLTTPAMDTLQVLSMKCEVIPSVTELNGANSAYHLEPFRNKFRDM